MAGKKSAFSKDEFVIPTKTKSSNTTVSESFMNEPVSSKEHEEYKEQKVQTVQEVTGDQDQKVLEKIANSKKRKTSKGAAPRLNIGFLPGLEEWVRINSIREELSITAFVNKILLYEKNRNIDEYHIIQAIDTQGKKGKKAERINVYFYDGIYEWVCETARKNGMKNSMFINQVLLLEKMRREE